jgi:DNA-binding transcriptional LysR family regulator
VELHQVRYFLALARTLNFTRAAEQCGVTQSALTKSVQKLEYELGAPLIHRERHLTQLTDLGKIVLPMLEKALEAADTARLQAKEYTSNDRTPLRIGLAPSISASLLVEPLAELVGRFPGLQIELMENTPEELVTALLEGEIHAAVSGQIDELPDRIDHWKLFEERYVAIVSRSHPFACRATIPVAELQKATWLAREACEVVQRFVDGCFNASGSPKIVHRGRQEGHLQHMVAAGLGVLLAPEHAPCLPSVVSRPIEGNPVRRWVELMVVAGRRHSAVLEAFAKITRLKDWCRQFERPTADALAADALVNDVSASAVALAGAAAFGGGHDRADWPEVKPVRAFRLGDIRGAHRIVEINESPRKMAVLRD